jgi:hypothetical protein
VVCVVGAGEDIDEGGDPPRIWSKYGEYPGTAFTRSLGDSIAEELGVFAGTSAIHHRGRGWSYGPGFCSCVWVVVKGLVA